VSTVDTQKRYGTGSRGSDSIQSSAVRFSGDSGDGMQVVGEMFATCAALSGAYLHTFPDYPAEIRAPAGTLPGVSAFQIHFGSQDVETQGDWVDTLVAMNPAALRVNIDEVAEGGLLLVNTGAFTEDNLSRADYTDSPLDALSASGRYHTVFVNINQRVLDALKGMDFPTSDKIRCKNFFALGLTCRLYGLSIDYPRDWISNKWGNKPALALANETALEAGYTHAEKLEVRLPLLCVDRALLPDGIYRKISGNEAMALGLIAGSEKSWREIVCGSYPITPATPILEELAQHKHFMVKTVQAEDEISAIGIAIGASYAGHLGVTSTSGPGLCLKSEGLGLAVMTELPLVVIDVMRAGPSTGLPTKTEQADLFMALFGRHGESPVPVLAARSPSDCFRTAFEAVQVAVMCRTPVIVLSDASIGNGSEQWRVPTPDDLPEIEIDPMKRGESYKPYERDPVTGARRLGLPGRPGFEHRIGGLEKDEKGQISQDPANHEHMVEMRARKVQAITRFIPPTEVAGAREGDLLVVGWGGSYGAISLAVKHLHRDGYSVGHVHLRYLHPLPSDLGQIITCFKNVLVPELNQGQLAMVLRAAYLRDVQTFSRMQGRPFRISEIRDRMETLLKQSSRGG